MKRPNKRAIRKLFAEIEQATSTGSKQLPKLSSSESDAYKYMVDSGFLTITPAKGYVFHDGHIEWQNPTIVHGITASGHDYYAKLRWGWWGKLTGLIFLLAAMATIAAFFMPLKADDLQKPSEPTNRRPQGPNVPFDVEPVVDGSAKGLLGETKVTPMLESQPLGNEISEGVGIDAIDGD